MLAKHFPIFFKQTNQPTQTTFSLLSLHDLLIDSEKRGTLRPCPCTKAGARKWGAYIYFPHGNALQDQFLSVNMAQKIQVRRKQGFLSPAGSRQISVLLPMCNLHRGGACQSAAFPFGASYLPFRYKTDARTQPGQHSWLLTGRL